MGLVLYYLSGIICILGTEMVMDDALLHDAAGDVMLPDVMPQAEYMYGCTPTALAMLLGYWDLYGYADGTDLSDLIEGDISVLSRGTDGNIFNMNAFDTVLGNFIASEDYVYRFYSRDDIEIVISGGGYSETTAEEEFEYAFVSGTTELDTGIWNCLADYIGTGQYWRGMDNLSTRVNYDTLENIANSTLKTTVSCGNCTRIIDYKYTTMLYGLDLYVRSRGYKLDYEITGTRAVDCNGGDFTFADYMAEIDAGRAVLISIEGHSMVGYGYNAATMEIIFDDTYAAGQRMTWNGTYNFSGQERALQAITVIGFYTAQTEVDLGITPAAGCSTPVVISAGKASSASDGLYYEGDTLYLTFAVANTGNYSCSPFDVSIYLNGNKVKTVTVSGIAANAVQEFEDVVLDGAISGVNSLKVVVDDGNVIQETSGAGNTVEQSFPVLRQGAEVVSGTKTVGSGSVSSNACVVAGGRMYVSGGTAESPVAVGELISAYADGGYRYSGGFLYASNGGTVRELQLLEYGFASVGSGGRVESAVVGARGGMTVLSGGMAEDVEIYSGGTMYVKDSAAAVNMVNSGTVIVSSGGKLSGTLRLAPGASTYISSGGTVDFTVAQCTAADGYLVNDLSLISGTPGYSVTVSATQAAGTYKLAQGAENFAGSITIGDGTAVYGTLAANGAVYRNGISYNLILSGGDLKLTVSECLTGSKDGVNFDIAGENFIVRYSRDDFASSLHLNTSGGAVDTYGMPAGTYQWLVAADGEEYRGNDIVSDNTAAAEKLISDADGSMDLFFARSSGIWDMEYSALHAETGELVSLDGKNRFRDLFSGSNDASILVLTDDANGDALFVDDVYSTFGEQARLSRIGEIRAGAGNDIVDLTSDKYDFSGGVMVYGGAGDDTIWADSGENHLFGDAGCDRIVGGDGDDFIIGGAGDDLLHGGGGSDTFTFGNNWGNDIVEQLSNGKVTLYFASGSLANWDSAAQIYSDGINSVTVSGTSDITLKFGADEAIPAGAFSDAASEKIFEDKDDGMLA